MSSSDLPAPGATMASDAPMAPDATMDVPMEDTPMTAIPDTQVAPQEPKEPTAEPKLKGLSNSIWANAPLGPDPIPARGYRGGNNQSGTANTPFAQAAPGQNRGLAGSRYANAPLLPPRPPARGYRGNGNRGGMSNTSTQAGSAPSRVVTASRWANHAPASSSSLSAGDRTPHSGQGLPGQNLANHFGGSRQNLRHLSGRDGQQVVPPTMASAQQQVIRRQGSASPLSTQASSTTVPGPNQQSGPYTFNNRGRGGRGRGRGNSRGQGRNNRNTGFNENASPMTPELTAPPTQAQMEIQAEFDKHCAKLDEESQVEDPTNPRPVIPSGLTEEEWLNARQLQYDWDLLYGNPSAGADLVWDGAKNEDQEMMDS